MGFGSADDYYSGAFDYYDDAARAGTIIFTTFDILIAVISPIASSFSMDFKLSPQVAKIHYPENFQPKAVVRN